MKALLSTLLFFLIAIIYVHAQHVGVNTDTPETELDVRSTGLSIGSDFNLSSPLNERFIRLRSHTKTNDHPGIWWKNGLHLKMYMADEDGSHLNEFLQLDGKTIHILNTGQSTFIGRYAGNNDNGVNRQNVAIGDSAMYHNISGQHNVGLGYGAFRFGTGGSENTALGYKSMNNLRGNGNTSVGFRSLHFNDMANDNTAIGSRAMEQNTIGVSNTAVGMSALLSNETGSGNIAIGQQAGANEMGSDKLYIDNSSTANPLIYGEFDNNHLRVNGSQDIAGELDIDHLGVALRVHGTEAIWYSNDRFSWGFGNASLTHNQFEKPISVGPGSSIPPSAGYQFRVNGAAEVTSDFEVDDALFVDQNLQRVGIGTTQPREELHIKDEANTYALLEAGAGFDPVLSLKNINAVSGDAQWTLRMDGSQSNRFQMRYNNASQMVLTTDGDLVLGNTVPANGYKLSVDGKIIAEEVRIQLQSAWPDYVFNEEYKLMPLKDLNKSIQRDGHLPGIPSAAILEKEGIDAGEMQRKMMEKIEELTLYIIELNNQNEQLIHRIESLEKNK